MNYQNEYRESSETADDIFGPGNPYPVVIKPMHFILLSFCSLGLYNIWWQYKCWKYFKDKENLDIMPAARSIIFLIFGAELFDKIADYGQQVGHQVSYNSRVLWLLCIGINLLGRLPSPYYLISILSFLPLLPPVKAFNYYFTGNNEGYKDDNLNPRQILLVIAGCVCWLLIIGAMFTGGA